MTNSDCVDALLLDIEGTTTPVDYVFGILFPFARVHVDSFLQAHTQDSAVQADLKRLWQEYETDIAQGLSIPEWKDNRTSGAVPYIDYLISIDRKSTELKSLQGKIWEQGYRDGTLRSPTFTDVKPAFERWTSALKKLFIFSSGSVQAQQLLFQYTEVGDLTGFLSDYFDTKMGPKKAADSYHKIAQTIKIPPARILFISDVVAELRAAQSVGMRVLFCLRPGNLSSDSEGFSVIQSFNGV
ncbi:MAG: acireductone synthase [Chroococcidiopsidaceae cyanobacterium CP_BM_RX_35]|nr:acireductone synthase [Chroococcidiopsidaceae cyanobacterium CP_BM_RX_35]